MLTLILILLGAMSALSLVLFAIDKISAKHGGWRIPEAILLGVTFFGGSVGTAIGMFLIRHKCSFPRKWYFHFTLYITLALQALILLTASGVLVL